MYSIIEFLDFSVFLDFSLFVDTLDSSFQGDSTRIINAFLQGNEELVVFDVWTETTNTHGYGFLFEFTQLTGKFEELQGFLQGDGFHELPFE